MCGRFTLRTPMTVLIEQFQLGVDAARQMALFEPRYNIAPTQDVLVVRVEPKSGRGQREAVMLRWGLVPSWSKELQSGAPLINARGETIAEKPSFRTAVRRRRCLIPADGFYEWQKDATAAMSAKKQPFLIHYRDDRPFAFAGLWESWTGISPSKSGGARDGAVAGAEEGLTIESCTIVTTSASSALAPLHDRMPVILEPSNYAEWLDPAVQDPAKVQHLVVPNDDPEIIYEPVSMHVNRVANADARCVQVQRGLFD